MVEVVSRTTENPNRPPAASGPPLRAFAMVLISLAILFAGIGFASLGGSDDNSAAPAPATTTTTTAAAAAPAPAGTAGAQPSRPAAAASATGPATTGPATTESAAPTTSAAASTSQSSALADTSASVSAPIRVYNNSTVAGLAAQTASFLEDEGFAISETGNYSEGLLTSTAVYYGTTPGEQQVATEVAEALGVSAQPRFEGIRNAPAGVIVIVTSQS